MGQCANGRTFPRRAGAFFPFVLCFCMNCAQWVLERIPRMSFDGSPSSSSRSTGSSDDFAALLDAELLLDKQSSADDENVTAGGSQGGGEQQEEEEEEEEEDDDDDEEEEENDGEHEHEDGDHLDEILEGGSESSQGLGLGFDGVLTTEEEEDKAEDKEGLDTGVGSLQRLRSGNALCVWMCDWSLGGGASLLL